MPSMFWVAAWANQQCVHCCRHRQSWLQGKKHWVLVAIAWSGLINFTSEITSVLMLTMVKGLQVPGMIMNMFRNVFIVFYQKFSTLYGAQHFLFWNYSIFIFFRSHTPSSALRSLSITFSTTTWCLQQIWRYFIGCILHSGWDTLIFLRFVWVAGTVHKSSASPHFLALIQKTVRV